MKVMRGGMMMMMMMMMIATMSLRPPPHPHHFRGLRRTHQTPDPTLHRHLIPGVRQQEVDLVRPIQVSRPIQVNRIQNQTLIRTQRHIHPARPGVVLVTEEILSK